MKKFDKVENKLNEIGLRIKRGAANASYNNNYKFTVYTTNETMISGTSYKSLNDIISQYELSI